MKYARSFALRPLLATFSLLLALLTGCNTPEEITPPPQLMPKDKLISLLVQLHLLEARVEASHLSQDSARALFQSQKNDILWKNNIVESDSVLPRSYRYYTLNRKDMDEIYAAVIDSLEHRETQLTGAPKKGPEHPW